MKKFLLVLFFLAGFASTKAQTKLWFNEIYVADASTPTGNFNSQNKEFIEFYNTSTVSEVLDCYVVVAYFNNSVGQGAYVYKFPTSTTMTGNSYATISASTSSNIKTSAGSISANGVFRSWNSIGTGGYLTKYLLSGGTWQAGTNPGTSFNDMLNTSGGGNISLFLYKITSTGTTLVNGILGNTSATIPAEITSLPDLSIPPGTTACSSASTVPLKFSTITINNVEVSSVIAATGNENGYAKTSDGICNSWAKLTGGYTPGNTNGNAQKSKAAPLVSTKQYVTDCNGQPTLNFEVLSPVSNASIFNITAKVYNDAGTLGVFDGSDAPVASLNKTIIQDSVDNLYTQNVLNTTDNYLIIYSTALGCYDNVAQAPYQQCSVLPVHFVSFNASRKDDKVNLTWTTASEQNSRGFQVQRNTGNEWKDVAFVFSQAANGNSTSELSYSFTDVNSAKGVTQYRILQVDLDGSGTYSQVRAVPGSGAVANKLVVFPNPSSTGSVTLLFSDQGSRLVMVNDVSGRTVQQFKNVRSSSLELKNLTSGFYTVQVKDGTTGATTTEKFIVTKR